MPALWSCAAVSPLAASDGGFRNARHGYWIGQPSLAAPPWKSEEVEGSLLAYHAPGARMTFSSRCGGPLASPEYLARHLRIGIPAYVIREAGPVTLNELTGWQQTFDADAERGAVRVKTVTFAANGCALDWVLIAREASAFEQAEPLFDAWWATLAVTPAPDAPSATASDGSPAETAP